MIAPALGGPDLDDVVFEREEAQAERPRGAFGGDGGAVQGGGEAGGVEVTARAMGPRSGPAIPAASSGTLERLLAGGGRVALGDRHAAAQDRLERVGRGSCGRDASPTCQRARCQRTTGSGRLGQLVVGAMHDRGVDAAVA